MLHLWFFKLAANARTSSRNYNVNLVYLSLMWRAFMKTVYLKSKIEKQPFWVLTDKQLCATIDIKVWIFSEQKCFIYNGVFPKGFQMFNSWLSTLCFVSNLVSDTFCTYSQHLPIINRTFKRNSQTENCRTRQNEKSKIPFYFQVEECSESCQTPKTELFVKKVNGFQLFLQKAPP